MAFALIFNINFLNINFQPASITMQTPSKKGMTENYGRTLNEMQSARLKQNIAREHNAQETGRGQTRSAATGRTIGSATKDERHGVHTDHGTSRRTESRRQGSMGSESKSKSQRKNV
jgi:hypothetical protein